MRRVYLLFFYNNIFLDIVYQFYNIYYVDSVFVPSIESVKLYAKEI